MGYQPPEPGLPCDPWDPWGGPGPEEPTDAELLGLWPDPFAGPPEDADRWQGDLSDTELGVVTTSWSARHPADLGDAGFGSGGPLDLLPPDRGRAFAVADANEAGWAGCPMMSWSGCWARPGGC